MKALSHTDFLALKRFPALDGLRAVAALMVVFFHNEGPGWIQGWIGVQIFFVLSGFLITTLLLREEARTGRVSFRAFYLRRAFRILPAYFLVLGLTLLGLLVAGLASTVPPGTELPLYLLFFNEFGHGGPYGQSWSLGIEQKFYLLWPALAFSVIVAGRARRRLGMTLGLMALTLVAVPFTVAVDPRGWPVHYFSVLAGCLLAIVMHSPRGYRLVRPLTKPAVATGVAVLFLLAHLMIQPATELLDKLPGGIPGFVWVCPFYAVAVAILLPAVLAKGLPQRLLSGRTMAFLGERSYSIYLVQSIAQGIVLLALPVAGGLLKAVLVSAVAVVLAHVTHRWVELPMIRLGRRRTAPSVA